MYILLTLADSPVHPNVSQFSKNQNKTWVFHRVALSHAKKVSKHVVKVRISQILFRKVFEGDYESGALKQGPCTCSTFKAFNLTYLHILCS